MGERQKGVGWRGIGTEGDGVETEGDGVETGVGWGDRDRG
jgi:hypothetical protein